MGKRKAACRLAKTIKFAIEKKLGDTVILNVNPADIKLYSMGPYRMFKNYWQGKRRFFESLNSFIFDRGEVMEWLYFIPGDWDLESVPFKKYHTYQHMEELYSHNYDYTKTRRYQEFMAKIEAGTSVEFKGRRLKSKEDLLNYYFQPYINVFKSMEEEGYLSSIFESTGCVAIGRNGDLIKTANARHRLSIARLLGIKSIPVKLEYIHPLWRKKKYQGELNNISLNNLYSFLETIKSKYS